MDIIAEILRYARSAPSADNSQPWQFHVRVDGFDVSYASARVQGRTFAPFAPATLLAVGALLENIVQGAAAIGADISIDRWPSSGGPDPYYLKVSTSQSDLSSNSLDTARSDAILTRHTNRHPYRHSPVDPAVSDNVRAMREKSARVIWMEGSSVREMARIIQTASCLRFQNRVLHEWLADSLRFSRDSSQYGDGLDIDTLALPPGGAALMKFLSPWRLMDSLNRLGVYKLMALIEAMPTRQAPALFAIASGNARDEIVDAGMLMERVWIALNAAGLSVQPYYVVSDQIYRLREGLLERKFIQAVEDIERDIRHSITLQQDEFPQILFRVGTTRRHPNRSRRLAEPELVAN